MTQARGMRARGFSRQYHELLDIYKSSFRQVARPPVDQVTPILQLQLHRRKGPHGNIGSLDLILGRSAQ
jgi:hypothetical protein